jgi:Ca-activated chloride channel homolog
MMSINNPIAFLFALVIPVIVALYLLKLKRKRRVISSTFFWSEMVQDLQANVPFQKLRWNILLFLQILIATAIILAMTDPGIRGSLNEGQRTIFVIDTSASMSTKEGDTTRLEEAISDIRKYCERLAYREQVMIIEAGEHTQTLLDFTSNISSLKRTLDSVKVHDTRTDITTAWALAQSKASEVDRPMIVIVSDFSGVDLQAFANPKYPTRTLQIGRPGKNVAITDFSFTSYDQSEQDPTVSAFLVVRNFLDVPIKCKVEFYVDGGLVDARTIDVDRGTRVSKLFKGIPYAPAEGSQGVLEARLNIDDDLQVDNSAWATPSKDQVMSVLIVGDDPFLPIVLNGLPGIQLFQLSETDYAPGGFDLTFFTDWAPDSLPSGNYVFLNPPDRDYLPCSLGAAVENPQVTDWEDSHPLLRFVNPGSFKIFSASKLGTKPGALTLIDGSSTPLMVYGEKDYLRTLVFPFNLAPSNTDLVTRPTFPILMLNIVSFFRTYQTNASSGIRTEGISPISVDPLGIKVKMTAPDGSILEFPVDGGHAFVDVDHVGVYTIQVEGSKDQTPKTIVANFFDESESDIVTPVKLDLGQGSDAVKKFDINTERRIWKWLSMIAVLVLTVEWIFYHRKGF